MTSLERPIDYHEAVEPPIDYREAVNDFLKLHKQELELQAIKLTGFYGIDFHELLSRTSRTVWKKWPKKLCTLPGDEKYRYARRILFNHARNLSKSTRRDWNKREPSSGDELERSNYATTTGRDPAVEAIFREEIFAIYRAITQLHGRRRDVMVLVALGLENNEIRQELDMTVTNLTTTLKRARKSLREILELEDGHEGGELL
jgi:DNA-directed RNA polymerase specialized sigma24 family protein